MVEPAESGYRVPSPSVGHPGRWRFLLTEPAAAAANMALDAGLIDRAAATGEAVVRVYSWARPTLSFGRHESVNALFRPADLEAAGLAVVRRPTGGRVLLHDHEATYSVTAPVDEGEPLKRSYERINRLLVLALEQLGVDAVTAPPTPVRRPGDAACFAEPSAGELVVNGRKLVGSAQVRERGALLQHGSILFTDQQSRITALAVRPMTPSVPAAALGELLGRAPSVHEVAHALRGAVAQEHGAVEFLDTAEAWSWAQPHRARYDSLEWTWRR
jgi:lipoate-protein ligase A